MVALQKSHDRRRAGSRADAPAPARWQVGNASVSTEELQAWQLGPASIVRWLQAPERRAQR
jgi:hypothetical protein